MSKILKRNTNFLRST